MPAINLKHPVIPSSLRGAVACNVQLIPYYWSTIWIDGLRACRAESSNNTAVAAVQALYKTAEEVLHISLDRVITDANYEGLRACLGTHFQRLNNSARQRGVNLSKNWGLCLAFIEDILEQHLGANDDQWEEIKRRLYRLERTYDQLVPARSKEPAPIRALPALIVEELHDIFDPKSSKNPFRSKRDKLRNFMIFLILIHLGLRRGELLVLKVNAFQAEYDPRRNRDVCWLIVDYVQDNAEDDELPDPRSSKPSLKNNLARRLLPVSPHLLAIVDAYLGGHRRKMNWAHLFVSQKSRPLSARRLNEIFEIVTDQLSPAAKALLLARGKHSVQPHDLRHTCAVRRLSAYRASGYAHVEAIEKLRVFFGWGENSPMPGRYARAYYETDYDTIWQDNYDSYVDAIRSLEGVQ